MPKLRAITATAFAGATLALTGCGADNQPAVGGGAEIAPADTPAFIAVDSDLGSAQWQALDDLLDKFPGKGKLLRELRSSLKDETGLDYKRDVKPALGDEIDFVWLDFEAGGTDVVAITKPKDEEAFRRMIATGNRHGDDKLVVGEVEGWTVVADTQTKLDSFRQKAGGTEKLADEKTFTAAMGELPDDALAKAYVRGADLIGLMEDLGGGAGLFNLKPEQRPEYLAAALGAEDKGLLLEGVARTEREPKQKAETFESKLDDDVPSDVLVFVSLRGGAALEDQLGQVQSDPTTRETFRQLEALTGFRFERLFGLFENEVAFYVRPGGVIPELTLLLEAPDRDAILARVDQLLRPVARKAGAKTTTLNQGGLRVKVVDFGPIAVYYAAFDDRVVVTSALGAIREARSGEDKVADDDDYRDARTAAGVPDETGGLFYVNLRRTLPVVLNYLQVAGESSPDLEPNLEPLRSFIAWAEADGRTARFSAFLRVD